MFLKPLSSHSIPAEWPRRDLEGDLIKVIILVSSRFLENCLPSNKLKFVPFNGYFYAKKYNLSFSSEFYDLELVGGLANSNWGTKYGLL